MKNLLLALTTTLLFAKPEFEVLTNNNPYPANILVHSFGNPKIYMSILDTSLNYYWSINNSNKGMDFKYNNSSLSYFYKPGQDDIGPPKWIIANHSMEEVDTIQCTLGNTDYHDMIITDNNTYILQSYNNEIYDFSSIGFSQYELVKGVLRIQEFDLNDNLIFEWYAADHIDIFEYAITINPLIPELDGFTWMHGNSIDVDFDNNLIISNRTNSEIIKIDRLSGEVLWIMGGPLNEFTIINDPLNGTAGQHDVTRLDNGNILIFDNGNEFYNNGARVIEYLLDEINKTATLVWEYNHPDGFISRAMGNAQRLPNGNTFINWGTILVEGASIGARITEVSYEKEIVLDIQYNDHLSYKITKSNFEFDIPMMVGDLNLDNMLNIQDIIYSVNYILSSQESHSMFHLYKIDLNFDHSINIIDIISIVNLVLGD